jgi:putative metallohydrolase (TIGR04338 family)
VYAAQEALPPGRTFTTLDEIQAYVDELRENYWWPEWVLRIEVHSIGRQWRGLARWDADAGAGVIGISKDGMSLRTVVHEVAHVLADARGSTSHDPRYCRQFLELVYHCMGSEQFIKLRDSFEQHGVVHDEEVAS